MYLELTGLKHRVLVSKIEARLAQPAEVRHNQMMDIFLTQLLYADFYCFQHESCVSVLSEEGSEFNEFWQDAEFGDIGGELCGELLGQKVVTVGCLLDEFL